MSTLLKSKTSKKRYTLLLILNFTLLVTLSCVQEEDGFFEKKFLDGTNVIEGPPVGPDEDAELVIEDAYLEFGKVPLFYPARKVVEIKNTGGYPATILSKFPTYNFSFLGGEYPGRGGTCGVVVSSSETCKLVFGFTPTEEKIYNETLVFEYNTGYTNQNVIVDMIGSGVDIPFVYFEEYDIYNFGQAFVSRSGYSESNIYKEVTLKYAGGKNKSANNIFINKILAPFEKVNGGTCVPGQSLSHGDSCTIKLRFNPFKKFKNSEYGQVESYSSNMVVSYYNGVSKNYPKVMLKGSATSEKIGAVLNISGAGNFTADYKVYPKTKIQKEFVITKISGNQDAIGLNFKLKDNKLFKVIENSCENGPVLGTCSVIVEFTAGDTIIDIETEIETAATFSDTLVLAYNNGLDIDKQESAVDLSGTSGAKPIIKIHYASACKSDDCEQFNYYYSFGDVSTRYTKTKTFQVRIVNKDESVPVEGLSFDLESKIKAPFSIHYNGGSRKCSNFKESKLTDYCYFYMAYRKNTLNEIPTSFDEVIFNVEQAINLPDNPIKDQVSLKISGRPSPKALLVVSGYMNWGWVIFNEKSALKTMTVYHYGEEPASNIKIYKPENFPKPFFYETEALGTCKDTLEKGERCTIGAYFAPTLETVGYNTTRPHATNSNVENRYRLSYSNGFTEDTFVENGVYSFGDFLRKDEVKTNYVEFKGYARGPGLLSYKTYLPTIDQPTHWEHGNHFVRLYNNKSEYYSDAEYNLSMTIKSVKFLNHSDVFSASGCTSELKANKSCDIKVFFDPKELHDYSTQMVVEYENGSGELKTSVPIDIIAKGYAQIELLSTSPVAIPDVPISSEGAVKNSSSILLVFSNSGNVKAVDLSIAEDILPLKFTLFDNECAGSLLPGAKCTATLVFTSNVIPGRSEASVIIAASNIDSKSYSFVANSTVEEIIAAGEGHNCVRNKLAQVLCWGENRRGQLGRDTNVNSYSLKVINFGLPADEFVIDLTAGGGNHTCILTNKFKAKCWGANDNGQLGIGDTIDRGGAAQQFSMKNLSFISEFGVDGKIRKIVAGVYHTCAIVDESEQLYCFGLNSFGQLGNKSTENSSIPVKVELDKIKDVVLGGGHSCALNSEGEVFCFGGHEKAQIGGLGEQVNYTSSPFGPIDLGAGLKVSSISAQGGHTCAVIESTKEIKCWGENRYGDANDAELVGILGSCWARNIFSNDIVKCWDKGADSSPMYGYGFSAVEMGENLPSVVLESVNTQESTEKFSVEKVVASNLFTCVIGSPSEDREVMQLKCFGDNSSGQILQGEISNFGGKQDDMDNLKTLYSGKVGDIKTLVSGPQHMCAMFNDNSIKCWGGNNSYQLGTSNLALVFGDDDSEKLVNSLEIIIP